MRERKFIKFRVDMYEDTKFKIIDRMPERDVIFYLWTRLVALVAKVNLDGDLYMSRTIPYTIETLAIEINRSVEQVELALKVFMELEMVELAEGNVYRVTNFAKHQNTTRAKEKKKAEYKGENTKNNKIQNKENVQNNKNEDNRDSHDNEIIVKGENFDEKEKLDNKTNHEKNADKGKECKKEVKQNKTENIETKNMSSQDNINKNSNPINNALGNEKIYDNLEISVPTTAKAKKGKKKKKRITSEITCEDFEPQDVMYWIDGDEIPLNKGEKVISKWSFD